jgi:hypothetical protein
MQSDSYEVVITPNRTDLGETKALRLSIEEWGLATRIAPVPHGGCSRPDTAVLVERLKKKNDPRLGRLVAYLEEHCRYGFTYERAISYRTASSTDAPRTEPPTRRDPLAHLDVMELFRHNHGERPVEPKPELRSYTGRKNGRA